MPQNAQGYSNLFLTFSEPLLKASYQNFKAFKKWTHTSYEEFETPSLNHPLAITLLDRLAHVFLEDITLGLPYKRST